MVADLIIGCEGRKPNNALTVGIVCRGILTRHEMGKLDKDQKITVTGICPDYETCQQSLWTMRQQRKINPDCQIKPN